MTTAAQFTEELYKLRTDAEQKKYERYFPLAKRGEDEFIGVRMGDIFKLAKTNVDMSLDEVEKLLESPVHEVRVGAVSILDYRARDKKITDEQYKRLFELYLKRHDRINTWDLVDRSAIYVVGGYLRDKPRDILYKLAKSKHMPERRTAIVSTMYFGMRGDTKDTFAIAELLLNDEEDLIHKAVGWALRTAGGEELLAFLDKHAARMPRVMLRYAIEKLSPEQKKQYLAMGKATK